VSMEPSEEEVHDDDDMMMMMNYKDTGDLSPETG
jgi:hypothetical protein